MSQLCVALRGAVLSYSCRLLTSFTEAEKIEKAKKKMKAPTYSYSLETKIVLERKDSLEFSKTIGGFNPTLKRMHLILL